MPPHLQTEDLKVPFPFHTIFISPLTMQTGLPHEPVSLKVSWQRTLVRVVGLEKPGC